MTATMRAPAGAETGERDRSDAHPDGTTHGSNSTNCTAIEGDAQSILMARARDGSS